MNPEPNQLQPEPRSRAARNPAAISLAAATVILGVVAMAIGGLSIAASQRTAAAAVAPIAQVVPATPAPSAPSTSSRQEAAAAVPTSAKAPTRRIQGRWTRRIAAATGIPARALLAYASASVALHAQQPGCGIGWNTLAAIGYVESGHASHGGATLLATGRTNPTIIGPALDGNGLGAVPDSDRGRWDDDATWDHAVGPMQFLPTTWRKWGTDGNHDSVADPFQIDDAALTAARYLCASGSMRSPAGWRAAIFSYNHSAAYVDKVAQTANQYAAQAQR